MKKYKQPSEPIEIFGVKYLPAVMVANLFKVTPQSVTRWALFGEISGTKIGKFWYFTESNIKDYLNEKTKIGVART